jgi:hypothetical protein
VVHFMVLSVTIKHSPECWNDLWTRHWEMHIRKWSSLIRCITPPFLRKNREKYDRFQCGQCGRPSHDRNRKPAEHSSRILPIYRPVKKCKK